VTPTVSVVLNCYNHEPYIGEAIESVLAQTWRDFELILIDNGSTDGSRQVMQSYDDQRIRLVLHDRNATLSSRLNEGVAAARGKFVAVLYSDDVFLPRKLERQLAMFDELSDDYGVVYAPALRFNQLTGQRWRYPSIGLSGDLMPAILDRLYDGLIDMCSPLTRRECLVRYPFHDDLFADAEMVFFRIAMRWKFKFDPEPVVELREHDANIGRVVQRNHDMMLEVWARMQDHPDFPARYLQNLRHLRAIACRNHAWIALRLNSADRRWVARQIGRSLSAEPWQLFHPRLLASLVLVLSPSSLRAAFNRLGNRVRRTREETNLVHDY
jgi:glycosyltransferase involved in cell wall biosynthesis